MSKDASSPSGTALFERITGRFVPNAEGRARVADQLASSPDLREALDGCLQAKALIDAVASGSPFLWTLARTDPERLGRLLRSDPSEAHRALLESIPAQLAEADEVAAMRVLRRARAESALIIGLADLAGAWTCRETTEA